jgi:hypothetical protein
MQHPLNNDPQYGNAILGLHTRTFFTFFDSNTFITPSASLNEYANANTDIAFCSFFDNDIFFSILSLSFTHSHFNFVSGTSSLSRLRAA